MVLRAAEYGQAAPGQRKGDPSEGREDITPRGCEPVEAKEVRPPKRRRLPVADVARAGQRNQPVEEAMSNGKQYGTGSNAEDGATRKTEQRGRRSNAEHRATREAWDRRDRTRPPRRARPSPARS
jgi:hypothetical protein